MTYEAAEQLELELPELYMSEVAQSLRLKRSLQDLELYMAALEMCIVKAYAVF